MTELERLKGRIASLGDTRYKPFIDFDNPPTPEALALQLNRLLDQLESGEYKISEFDDTYLLDDGDD